jgi:hypothetical protein
VRARWLAVTAALCAIAGLGGCGGTSTRDRVAAYIRAVDGVQARSGTKLAASDLVYQQFSQGKLTPSAAAPLMAAATKAISSTRAQIAAVAAPAPARVLRQRLLAVYDANLELARESATLARFTPAAADALRPLSKLNAALNARLRAGAGAQKQASALALYAQGLGTVIAALRRLKPPPVLATSHHQQIARLSSVRFLAGSLKAALASGNAKSTALLLLRFRTANQSSPSAGINDLALLAYDIRLRAIDEATAALRREQLRLDRAYR